MAPPTILALLDHYLPGYKAGGPVRSMEGLVAALGRELRFKIASRDRDLGDQQRYPQVEPGRWYRIGEAMVTYLAGRELSVGAMRRFLAATEHDVLYLNSLFSPRMSLVPLLLRRLGLVPARPVVLAPRGELHPGALRAPRKWRMGAVGRVLERLGVPNGLSKHAYIALCRGLGLTDGIVWQASGTGERADIVRHFGPEARVMDASCLVVEPPAAAEVHPRLKTRGVLRVAYVSRIHAKKNVEGAIAALAGLRGDVEFNLYGPVDEPAYWARCQALLRRLPENVRWTYHGPIPHEQVAGVLREHDAFLLRTWGENFGHVIVEALLAGCPVVISDRTPWVDLARQCAGWDLPAEDSAPFTQALQRLVEMDEAEYRPWSRGAAELGRRIASNPLEVERNRELFEAALPPRAAVHPAEAAPVAHALAPAPDPDAAPR